MATRSAPENDREGTVVERRINAGSKSERQAVQLDCDDGLLTLRRRGGHPFDDPELRGLVGRRLRVHGVEADGVFLVARYEIVD